MENPSTVGGRIKLSLQEWLKLRNVTMSCLQQIFRPPLDHYDVIIHLEINKLPRQHQAVDISKETICPKYRNVETSEKEQSSLPVIDFDPAEMYLTELRVCTFYFFQAYGRENRNSFRVSRLHNKHYSVWINI